MVRRCCARCTMHACAAHKCLLGIWLNALLLQSLRHLTRILPECIET